MISTLLYIFNATGTNLMTAVGRLIPAVSGHLLTVIVVFVFFALAFLAVLYLYGQKVRKAEKKRQEELEKALEDAKKASAAKGDFMSRMSHEIRTPLNALIGYNSIAKSAIKDAQTDVERRNADMNAMDCLEKSEVASKHLLTVINDVLDMSAIESGKLRVIKEKFDFKNFVRSLTILFYTQAKEKNIKFNVNYSTLSEEWFVGDQIRINQILTNLLSNAVKFTPEGGNVSLKITGEIVDEKTMKFTFVVSDTGIGVEKDFLDLLWKPFVQADPSVTRRFGGSGLGLSITKSLVDLMNGKIDVESKPGKGTTFTVQLAVERCEQPEAVGMYDFSNVNALVIDDDRQACDYIKLLFDSCGARCTTVNSGAEAVNIFSDAVKLGDRFTMCIVDFKMPKMDGVEAIKRIHTISGTEVPVIIVTAYDYSEIAEKNKDLGITGFVSKPLFRSSLYDMLANITGDNIPSRLRKRFKIDFCGARIILTEDNKMNMEVAKRFLSSVGLIVDSAWNGNEAIELFEKAEAGTYKLILMDVHMPEMDGYTATKIIRASSNPQAADIPIIAMTADVFSEDVALAMDSGMNDHIAKPIDARSLINTLKKYIDYTEKE